MIVILIPAFDEAMALARLLPALPEQIGGMAVRTVVVNDGSTDDTSDVARSHGAQVIDLWPNQGKGTAIRAGLDTVRAWPLECVVLMDGDGQHAPGDLAVLVEPVAQGACDIALGSRYLADNGRGHTPRNRYLVRQAVVRILLARLGVLITDPFSGYRCLGATVATTWEPDGDRYEAELELLFDAVSNGWSMREVPVARIYSGPCSKMGAQGGAVIGRLRVLRQYAATIARKSDELAGNAPERALSRPTGTE